MSRCWARGLCLTIPVLILFPFSVLTCLQLVTPWRPETLIYIKWGTGKGVGHWPAGTRGCVGLGICLMTRSPAGLYPCGWQLPGHLEFSRGQAELVDKLLPCPRPAPFLTLNYPWAWGFSPLSTSDSQRTSVLKMVGGGQQDAAKNSQK